MALLVKTDRTMKVINADDLQASKGNNGELSLEDIHIFIGGYMQLVPLSPPLLLNSKEYVYLLCDEDGKMKKYPINHLVTDFLSGTRIASDDCIVGDVLLIERHEMS
ncbi:DUF3846 domain-containing protein [Klebsiella oxytoca]|uniref:DUF3846 domain-containing protein n=1 Tax=Klebsiella oxytoca TaxID=571 RepID=A0AAP2BJS0_KLEOX|nr:DUF3846 domain-containing protein [Klebsiella oxytoca]MBQ0600860.1 DUF3846 domain-containing protein [Klebsiella oxytoca]